MSLVAAKCTECGANIQVDDRKDASICEHCKTAFITQKAINNYTSNLYVTQNITKHIYGKEQKECEDFLRNGEVFIKLKDWDKAKECFVSATSSNPANYLGWLGIARCLTHDWTLVKKTKYNDYLVKAKTVATEKERELINKIELDYVVRFGCPACGGDEINKKYRCTDCGFSLIPSYIEECPACFHEIIDGECSRCGYNPVTKEMPDGTIFDPITGEVYKP